MTYMPRADAANSANWADLAAELDRWEKAGRVADLWWRDDDAVAATPQLDALLHLAGEVPVALAVIPALARPELAEAVRGRSGVALLQHGWRHANRAAHGKKSEYPEGRSAQTVAAEIGAGRARLKALFGPRVLPVLVPPWNRVADEFLPLLSANGIVGLSAMVSPGRAAPPPGVAAIDVHVDLVAWRGDRGFVGAGAALGGLVFHLRQARLGAADASKPIGVLTHHLIMDEATAAFLDRLTGVVQAHHAARWSTPGEFLS
jgi:peptidoglycan/xylan/chitin deacetylase (PgdA/CDA1 family)